MRESAYKTIDSVLKNYDIEALHLIGLPLGFSDKTGISDKLFEEYYEMKQTKNDYTNNIEEEKVVGEPIFQDSFHVNHNSFLDEAIRQLNQRYYYTTQGTASI